MNENQDQISLWRSHIQERKEKGVCPNTITNFSDKPWNYSGLGNTQDWNFSNHLSIFKNLLKTHQFGFTPQYLSVIADRKNEDNTIKVEKINGPILLLAAKEDAQWPSAKMSEMIEARLKQKQYLFPFQYEVFSQTSHILCPVKTKARFAYRVERTKQAECSI